MPVRLAMMSVWHSHAPGKAQQMRDLDEIELGSAWEPDPEVRTRRAAMAQFEGMSWAEDSAALLADERLQGVVVDGKVADNLDYARQALEAGKHVLLEKPAGTRLADFEALQESAQGRGLVIQMGYQFRYTPAWEFLLDTVRRGLLGRLFGFRARISTRQSIYEENRPELRRYPGGIFFELACHILDLAVACLGPPQRVTPFLRADFGPDPGYPDNTLAVLEYDQAVAVLETAAIEVEGPSTRRIEVYGTTGSLILEPICPCPTVRLLLQEPAEGYSAGWQEVHVGERPLFRKDLQEFVACLQGGKQPDFSPEHDLAVQETLLRCVGAP